MTSRPPPRTMSTRSSPSVSSSRNSISVIQSRTICYECPTPWQKGNYLFLACRKGGLAGNSAERERESNSVSDFFGNILLQQEMFCAQFFVCGRAGAILRSDKDNVSRTAETAHC